VLQNKFQMQLATDVRLALLKMFYYIAA